MVGANCQLLYGPTWWLWDFIVFDKMSWISYLNSHDKLNVWEWFLGSDFFTVPWTHQGVPCFHTSAYVVPPVWNVIPCFLCWMNPSYLSKSSACILFLLAPSRGIRLLCPWSHHCYLTLSMVFIVESVKIHLRYFFTPMSLPLDFEELGFKDLSDSASAEPYVCWMNKYSSWSSCEWTF